MSDASPAPEPSDRMTPRHWLIVLVLAAVQFTHIVDFMIVMPLAPLLQKGLGINPQQFALILSSYGFAAFAAGFVLARWLDRFDRKTSLLFLFLGFTAGTFVCAFAPDFYWLLAGRLIAGGFGGVAGAAALAIIGDAIPLARRGTATGAMMSAFSAATIAGVPAGLLLAEWFGNSWRVPFVALGLVCLPFIAFAAFVMPPLRSHLTADVRRSSLWAVMTEPAYVRAYLMMFFLYLGGFVVFSYLMLFLVSTVGVPEKQVKYVYLVGGLATLLSMNVIGRLSDFLPRRAVFQCLAAAFAVPALIVAHLPHGTPLAVVLTLTTLMMVLGSGRGIPALALVTTVPRAGERGSFLSVNSSVQQLAVTVGPLVTALFLRGGEDGRPLEGFNYAGWLSAGLGLLCVWLVTRMRSADEPHSPQHPIATPQGEAVESIVPARDARFAITPPRG